jgi:hypothetical protein
MAESTQIVFPYKELVEILLRKQGITSGIWGLYIQFGIAAANVKNPLSAEMNPAAIVPVLQIGIQKFEEEGNLSVDASKLSAAPKAVRKVKRSGTKT